MTTGRTGSDYLQACLDNVNGLMTFCGKFEYHNFLKENKKLNNEELIEKFILINKKAFSYDKIEDIDKMMLSDSVSTVAGSVLGTSTVTTYVESAAGVKAGGRTGMTSLTIGVLFLACLFFSPLATSLPKEVDAAALIYIATLFVRNITDISWDDAAEAGPAVLAMIAMPFTYSISNGIALAFVSYAAIKIFTGKFNETSPAIWIIAALSIVSFAVA